MILILFYPFILLIWMYAGYPLTLMFLSRIMRSRINRRSIVPKVSVIICTYNESAVIDSRIENLLVQDYPREKLEIIVVDSSTDKTREIIRKKWMDDVQLIEETERQGKAKAINLGLNRSSGEIIILSDGPTLFDPDTIKNIVMNFGDPIVGAVTGKYDPLGGEKLFWSFKNKLRSLEGTVDSTTFLSGELCAFRKDLVDKVDEDSIADDVNIAMKIREKGYRAIYDSSARFVEKVTSTSKDFITQKTRRAIGGIQETMRFKWMIFNPRFGLFGILIMPTRFLFTVLNPFIFLSFLASLTYILHKVNPYLILSFPILLVLTIVFKEKYLGRSLNNFLMTIYIQFLALNKYFRKNYNVRWKQVESSRI